MSVLTSSYRQSKLALFMQWIVSKLPPRLKRIVFVGLMLGVFNEEKTPDTELIAKINDTFRLADNPRAYELPMAVQRIIWKDFSLDGVTIKTVPSGDQQVLTSESKSEICEHITANLPEWLKYASNACMHNDLFKLITQIENNQKNLFFPV